MSAFSYSGRTGSGERVRGTIAADTAQEAIGDLRARALAITSLQRADGWRTKLVELASRRASDRAVLAFFRAFATMLRAGVTIRRALVVSIERCTDAALREALRAVLADVERGFALSAAMARRPRQFATLEIAMVRAGEAGGVLDDVLERVATVLERTHALRNRLRAALAYPAIVALTASLLIVFLLVRVIPMFAGLFAGFGVPLPAPTRLLLGAGAALSSPLTWCAAAAVAALVVVVVAASVRQGTPSGLDALRLRIPLVGTVIRCAIGARLTRVLGVLLKSGVPLIRALEVSVPVAGSSHFASALDGIARALRRGDALRAPLEACGLFDPLVVALVGAGEETGTVDAMLLAAAGYLDVELEAALSALAASIEPALIGVLGVVVGVIVFSIFLPLYTLIGSIQ